MYEELQQTRWLLFGALVQSSGQHKAIARIVLSTFVWVCCLIVACAGTSKLSGAGRRGNGQAIVALAVVGQCLT